MTFEEARAQFPVLDRHAYLQAGSVGPLARGTLEAMHGEIDYPEFMDMVASSRLSRA